MSDYLGDVAATQTVTVRFTTEDASGAPITLAGTPSARVRKGSGAGTTITAGVTLTVDVVTGQHVVDVDLTASASYTAGADYAIELSAGTVSGVSVVGKVLGTFSIANRLASDSSGVTTLLGKFSGITVLAQWLGLIAGKQTGNSTARTELRATGAGSGTFDETTDALEALRDNMGTNGAALSLAKTTNITGFNDLDAAAVNAEVDTALADYDGPTKAELDTAVAPLALEATLGTPAGASVSADIAAIEAQTDDIGVAGAGLTALASASNLALVKAVTDKMDDTLEDDGGTFRFTANALEEAPTGGTAPTVVEIADEVETRDLHLTSAYDAAKTASQAGDAMALTSGERTAMANALLDLANAVETGLTVRGSLRLALAALAGKLSGADTSTTTIRNAVADTKDRIVASTNATGRTSVTTDVS